MSWFSSFITSSLGRKLIMSLTGIFLILFLIVHLIGNLQLVMGDGGEAFNRYAYFMTHNKFIKVTSYGLYLFIILHAIQGVLLWQKNRSARGVNYAVKVTRTVGTNGFAAKNMMYLGILILAFLLLHMGDFWWAMKSKNLPTETYAGSVTDYQDLYIKVYVSFKQLWVVIAYLVGLLALAFHLLHGFQSAFQTLGLNHKKYTPWIKTLGVAYSILVPLGYAVLPVYFYLLTDIPDPALAERIESFQWLIQ
jgi:succinate dehydrogenase / fumarate reductase cytochrome b subunit